MDRVPGQPKRYRCRPHAELTPCDLDRHSAYPGPARVALGGRNEGMRGGRQEMLSRRIRFSTSWRTAMTNALSFPEGSAAARQGVGITSGHQVWASGRQWRQNGIPARLENQAFL